ncbi:MAG: Flp pilus assembly protein CpaB [Anaerotardibacter sp.]
MKRGWVFAGLICGILCALCIFAYTGIVYKNADTARQEAMARYGGEQVEVLVATRTIYPGETLNSSNVTKKIWLSDLLPEGALNDVQEISGKEVSSLIVSGEVVTESRFNASQTEITIPENMVAVSVPAKDVQAVGGAIKAGSRVDVYATGVTTSCLGKNILVLATNATDLEQSSQSQITWVTLAVDSSRVQDFVSASQSMELYFALPSISDSHLRDDGSGTQSQNDALNSGDSDEESAGSSQPDSDSPLIEESSSYRSGSLYSNGANSGSLNSSTSTQQSLKSSGYGEPVSNYSWYL